MISRFVALAVYVIFVTVPAAAADGTSPMCEEAAYRNNHPQICKTGNAAPGTFPAQTGGGGGGNGGLLGLIHQVTGGLL